MTLHLQIYREITAFKSGWVHHSECWCFEGAEDVPLHLLDGDASWASFRWHSDPNDQEPISFRKKYKVSA